ncbi:ankyrin repeat domain-containing protein [Aspergillus mulundensis]|uniref:Uncharacterized protein n=1 Tax=Aspergillus mulundensis TaxID=1810919 RepID=A0A3D8SW56_9EURO|nr:Uncharacterized protein DSM5745_02264 [Aspergillus mulundensis]RDW90489.1 Uncharacterized protein DSM5745_02264 [Aspergillus mulundensis]
MNPYKDLRIAIEAGDTQKAEGLLDSGLAVSVYHFVTATQNKHYGMLEMLLSKGYDINSPINDKLPSALVHTFEDVELVEWFLRHGADPNKQSRLRNSTPLSFAVEGGLFDIIKLLFENGGEVQRGQLLHYAAMRTKDDNHEVLQFVYNKDPTYNRSCINKMLDEGTPEYLMNERTGLGTPLHYAAGSGSVGMVQFLLDRGAVRNPRDPYGRTPLGYAIHNGHYHKIGPILNGGAESATDLEWD